jgi:hypothetical protein
MGPMFSEFRDLLARDIQRMKFAPRFKNYFLSVFAPFDQFVRLGIE